MTLTNLATAAPRIPGNKKNKNKNSETKTKIKTSTIGSLVFLQFIRLSKKARAAVTLDGGMLFTGMSVEQSGIDGLIAFVISFCGLSPGIIQIGACKKRGGIMIALG